MEKTDLYKLILGIILIAAGILSVVLLEVLDIDMLIPIILVNIGLIIFVVTVFRLFRRGDLPDRDERTKKLAAYGITYSWLLTLVIIVVLSWVQYFGLAELTADGVLGILLFFMIISANVFRWYFMRKGDIE
ncbi:MAG: hypothetical protein ACOX7X_09990 [Methanosarcina flavescens]|jgi:cytochrome b561|uniref:DUF2178 domain-containing protein n=1 Tax=Methanosarcina flavescens TaxID=1715806 RepID=A0A660HUK6_9EURY|nr:hypothetical protein [Methanosarcina flavescens]AYK15964.1 hypothetical protein AOB57_012885 [Methanosarcina flavescens]NLK33228.1 hypothetical protein [Methanosarcina flavescens]